MKKIYILICILLMGGGYLWAQSPIVAAEYFFDVDPGTGNGASLTIPNPADSIPVYAIPGNDVVYTINIQNTGNGPVDNDSLFLVDQLPEEV
ncbi:MAG: hypothetical protein AAFS00_10695, partial [Bacteroidota bacterium]